MSRVETCGICAARLRAGEQDICEACWDDEKKWSQSE